MTTTAFIFLDLLCISVGLGLGAIIGAWLYGNHLKRKRFDSQCAKCNEKTLRQILNRVQELATGTAKRVGQHSDYVEQISAELATTGAAKSKAVEQIVDRLLGANQQMQKQLDLVETRLEEQAEQIKSTEAVAMTDALTGLPNRRAFDDEMDRAAQKFLHTNQDFVISMFDVDYFKRFNDTHGHLAGDEVLRQVASVMKNEAMPNETPVRYGGEEFAIIHNGASLEDATRRVDKIRAQVEKSSFAFRGDKFRVTVSVGTAGSVAEENMFELLDRADVALYASKGNGRNQTHWHDGVKSIRFRVPKEIGSSQCERPTASVSPDEFENGVEPKPANKKGSKQHSEDPGSHGQTDRGLPLSHEQSDEQVAEQSNLTAMPDSDVVEDKKTRAAQDLTDASGNADTPSRDANGESKPPREKKSKSNKGTKNIIRQTPSLVNRTYFCSTLGRRVAAFRPGGETPGILLLHIDGLDLLRRNHGNDAGNIVMQAVAQFLSAATRGMDTIGQFDDAIFSMLLSNADVKQVVGIGERLRKAVAQCTLPLGDSQIKFTISVGMVLLEETDSAQGVLSRAEDALTEAIDTGGNRSCFKTPMQCQIFADEQPTLLG